VAIREDVREVSCHLAPISVPEGRSAESCQKAALQDAVEVEHDFEPAAAQFPQKGPNQSEQRQTVSSAKCIDQIGPREDQCLVDDTRSVNDARCGWLHEPCQMRAGIEFSDGLSRRQGTYDISHGAKPNDQQTIGGRR
jgi:hypothetical protein